MLNYEKSKIKNSKALFSFKNSLTCLISDLITLDCVTKNFKIVVDFINLNVKNCSKILIVPLIC